MESAYYLAVGVAGFLGYLILLKQRRLPAPLPPGPKGWPVLGNIDVLPSSHAWVKYSELGHQYGSIVYVLISSLGGADSTTAGIECFVLAMVLHTDEQIKAQGELDAVLGSGQLPTLSDRSRLPYVEALYTEVMRTYTFVPLGLPRIATEDVLHDGYFIPKGTTVVSNAWQFLRDPKMYRNPECFDPNRFLGVESRVKETDPRDYLFGYGRRICPGMHLAEATMWLACSSLLASFDIRPPEEDGRSVLPVPHFMDGSVSHPEHFECTIRPRVSMDRLAISIMENVRQIMGLPVPIACSRDPLALVGSWYRFKAQRLSSKETIAPSEN